MGTKILSTIKKIHLLLWGVPCAAVAATLFFSLRPLIQQAMVGIVLVWMYTFYLFVVQP